MILESNATLPEVPLRPAPWNLEGDAYVIALRVPSGSPALRGHLQPTLAHRSVRGTSLLMFVDYRRSDVGPYHELLFIPGVARFGHRRCATIGRIYVSTFDSVVNGRRNWGIPKDRADFDVQYGVDGTKDDLVRVRYGGQEVAQLRLRTLPFGFPVSSRLVPAKARTLAHHWEGQTFFTTPAVAGRVGLARVLDLRFGAELFPDVASAQVLGAAKLSGFRMTFPESEIEPRLL